MAAVRVPVTLPRMGNRLLLLDRRAIIVLARVAQLARIPHAPRARTTAMMLGFTLLAAQAEAFPESGGTISKPPLPAT